MAYYLVCYGFGCYLYYVRDFIGKVTSNLKLNLAIVICFTFWIHGATDAIDEHTFRSRYQQLAPLTFMFSDAIFYGGADRYWYLFAVCSVLRGVSPVRARERFFGKRNEMVHLPMLLTGVLGTTGDSVLFLLFQPTGVNTLFKCYLALVAPPC